MSQTMYRDKEYGMAKAERQIGHSNNYLVQCMKDKGWTPGGNDNEYIYSELTPYDDPVVGHVVMVATMQLPAGLWEVQGECNAWGQETVVYFGVDPKDLPTPKNAAQCLDLMYKNYIPRS